MKEEIGHLPGIGYIICQCCRNSLSWSGIIRGEFNSNKYICDACVRDSKINTILSTN